jgi:NADPH:quinone reductase-like Zn-dependent oxidoreductase
VASSLTCARAGVLDLFMAQPFGQKSLLQRMFTSSLQEEARALEEDIDAVADKVDDPVIVEKVRRFVYASKDVQAAARADASACRSTAGHVCERG